MYILRNRVLPRTTFFLKRGPINCSSCAVPSWARSVKTARVIGYRLSRLAFPFFQKRAGRLTGLFSERPPGGKTNFFYYIILFIYSEETIFNISSGILNILSVWEALLKLHTVKIEPPAHLLQWILKMKNWGFSVFFDVFSMFFRVSEYAQLVSLCPEVAQWLYSIFQVEFWIYWVFGRLC